MQCNTVLISNSNATPEKQILLNCSNVDSENPETNTTINYDTLTVEQKAVFDAAISLAESFIPAP
jgi:hypothetical protein